MSNQPPSVNPGTVGTRVPAAQVPQFVPFAAPDLAGWLAESAQAAAPDRKAFRLRLAISEHDLARGLDLNRREDFLCLQRRQLEPADAVIGHALAFLRDLGPRAVFCDEDGDAVRQAMAVAAAELIERGQTDSLLVICPAGEMAEWIERLRDGFGLPAQACGDDDVTHLRDNGCWVMNFETAARRSQQLADRAFKLFLIDEAHQAPAESVRNLRKALGDETGSFVFARSSSPMHDGFVTLHRVLELVRGTTPHPLGPWDEFVQLFLQGDAQARFPRKGSEDEFRARLSAWMRRDARPAPEAGAKRSRRTVKDHLVDPQPREKEYTELAWRAAAGFPEAARDHYLAAVLGGPWHFAEAVEKAIARNLIQEPGLRRMLQDLVVRGRSMRETAKTAELANLARKALKDKNARLLICVRSAATASGVAQSLATAGFLEQADALKEGQDGLNRLAIQRFVLGERRVLIAPDAAARGQVIKTVTDLIHFDLPLEPAEHVARLEHLGAADSSKSVVRRLILKGTAEEIAVHGAQQRLGFHELEPEEVSGWLADLGFHGEGAWQRFLLERVASFHQGAPREEELLPLLEKRKQAESARSERRRSTDRALGALGPISKNVRPPLEREAARYTVPQLVAASLELRTGGWHVTDDKRIVLEEGARHFELRTPEQPGRSLARLPAADERALVCEPGSWAWQKLLARFRDGSRYFLADARQYPLERVAKRLQEQIAPHGLILEGLNLVCAEEVVAGSLNLRVAAVAGPHRHEAICELKSCTAGHKLEAYLDAPETLPAPDGSRLPAVKELNGRSAEAVNAAFARVKASAEESARERSDLASFVAQELGKPAAANRPPAPPELRSTVEGMVGVLYTVATVEARVRHRDQNSAWPLQFRCVPVSGVLLDKLPMPANAQEGAQLWACAGGHLVAAGSIRTCATPGCMTGLCPEHSDAGTGLRRCDQCGKERCAEHAAACAGCGKMSCSEHLEKLSSGSLACNACGVALEDGRRFLQDEIAHSALSRRAGPKADMVRSALSSRWAFPDELVACEISGRLLLPDEIAVCARSRKRVARDLLFQDPVSGQLCLDEFFVASSVSGKRALPESMIRSTTSGRMALPEEVRNCGSCDARLLPDEGVVCQETGSFGCASHLRRCAESGDLVLPEGLGRCDVSGAEVRHGLLRVCVETGKKARPQFFETCASSGVPVLPEGLEACGVTGRRVRRSLLQTCSVTGRRATPEHVGTCSVSGRRVAKDLLVTCGETGVLLMRDKTIPCEETGVPCAPEALETCAASRRRARRSLMGVDDVSGQRVLQRLLRKCPRTGKMTLAERFGACSVTGAQVLASELAQCGETGRPALPDKLERCASTGVLAHPDQFVSCADSRRRILRRVAETCESSHELVAPGVLETCSLTGKRVMPSLLGINELTGSKVIKEMLVACERTGKKTLRANLVRSAVSGAEISEDIVARCEVTNAAALPEELVTCTATGKRVLPSLIGTCAVSGNKVLEDYLQTCEASGKRVRPDLLQSCSRSGRRMLPQFLGVSKMSGDRGAKELLVLCEASKRQVFADELTISELSGKRIGKDRALHCGISGLVVDVAETQPCGLCRQAVCTSEMLDGVCCACLELVGRRQGVDAGLATVGALQRDCKWAGSLKALIHGDTVRVLARRRFFGAFRRPWLVVLRRPGARGPGAPPPVAASAGETPGSPAGALEIVLQERVTRDVKKELKRRLKDQAKQQKAAAKAASASPAAGA